MLNCDDGAGVLIIGLRYFVRGCDHGLSMDMTCFLQMMPHVFSSWGHCLFLIRVIVYLLQT